MTYPASKFKHHPATVPARELVAEAEALVKSVYPQAVTAREGGRIEVWASYASGDMIGSSRCHDGAWLSAAHYVTTGSLN